MNSLSTGKMGRIPSIDVMRGLVIILMIVDHVRERFFYHIMIGDPINIEVASNGLFFTRLTSHLCAPTFVFLAGLSAWLYANSSLGEKRSPSYFLFTRGLFLVALEILLINQSWFGAIPPETVYLQVIWAIGVSMIALSVLVRLPYWAILTTGFVIIFGHNALTSITFTPGEIGYTLWTILHDRGFIYEGEAIAIKASYPVLPWIGVILLGYALGPLYASTMSSDHRTRKLLLLGVVCFVILVILRGLNIYGETLPWIVGENIVDTVISFLNFTKYPPSLDFLLLALGVCLLLLSWLDNKRNAMTQFLQTFGQAPMFIYVLHLYVLLFFYRLVLAKIGPNEGSHLFHVEHVWQIWAIAALLVAALYYPTKKFGQYKHSTDKRWVRYF